MLVIRTGIHKMLVRITGKTLNSDYFFRSSLRVATVREKVLENEKISRSGKSQGITFSVKEI